MYENPFDRKFGVEFEFNCNAITGMREYMDTEDPYYGRVLESKHSTLTNLLRKNKLEDFTVGSDGSEFEVKTPILSGPTGFKRMRRFLDLINGLGARTSLESDGLHVHHDAPEFRDPYNGNFNDEAIKKLVVGWNNSKEHIYKMVHASRRNRWACVEWQEAEIESLLLGHSRIESYGRRDLNIASLRRHNTIEIRIHEGTLDYEEVLSWVRFGQAFIGSVVQDNGLDSPAETPVEFMRNIRVSRNASRFLTRKVETNNPAFAW